MVYDRRSILEAVGLAAGGIALSTTELGCAALRVTGTFFSRTADRARYHTLGRILPENSYTVRITEGDMEFTWREEHNPALYTCQADISTIDRIPGMGWFKTPSYPVPTRATVFSPEAGETVFNLDGEVMGNCRDKALEVINGSDRLQGIRQYLASAQQLIDSGNVEYGRRNDGSPNNNVAVMTDGRLTYIAAQEEGLFGPKTTHFRVVRDLGRETELDLVVVNGLPGFLRNKMSNLVEEARNKVGNEIQDSVN